MRIIYKSIHLFRGNDGNSPFKQVFVPELWAYTPIKGYTRLKIFGMLQH